jgi:LuxR family transcriptional regulator, quorum-sensing system regulator CviR
MLYDPRDLSSCISGNDAVSLLELIHESLSCKGEEDFRQIFLKLEKLFPFDFAHAMLGYQDMKKKIVIDHAVNISFPEEWVFEFLARDYMQVAVVIRSNFMHYGLQHWPDSKKRLNETKGVQSLFNDFDMSNGYSHGSRPLSTEQHGSMFCFSGPSMEYNRRSEAILELIGPHLHLALSSSFRSKRMGNGNIRLSAREKEVLNWLKQGKSSWDMSMILGISQSTVNFHVYNVMQKLGAVNRPQAVAVATHMGIIALA